MVRSQARDAGDGVVGGAAARLWAPERAQARRGRTSRSCCCRVRSCRRRPSCCRGSPGRRAPGTGRGLVGGSGTPPDGALPLPPTKPFNIAQCLATPITAFTTNVTGGTRWVAVDYYPGGGHQRVRKELGADHVRKRLRPHRHGVRPVRHGQGVLPGRPLLRAHAGQGRPWLRRPVRPCH
jgi:hypothetical protein